MEKQAILNSYQIFLKTCNFDLQILIQSKKENLSNHILKINNNIEKEEHLKEISEEYIRFIKQKNIQKNSSSKNFYIIISYNQSKNSKNSEQLILNNLNEKYLKIKECLNRCGNVVNECKDSKEVWDIFFSFLNSRKYLNK